MVADDSVGGFFDLNVYPYNTERADNALTLNILTRFPGGFEYFSLTNIGRSSASNSYDEFDFYLSEQNIRWMIPDTEEALQLTAQALLIDGSDNEVFRLGVRVGLHEVSVFEQLFENLNTNYWVNFHGLQFDEVSGGYRWQIEHVFRITVLPQMFYNCVYLGGFADHNISHDGGTSSIWLEETQIGVRLLEDLYGVVEQRYNGFRVKDKSSFGYGLEYIFKF